MMERMFRLVHDQTLPRFCSVVNDFGNRAKIEPWTEKNQVHKTSFFLGSSKVYPKMLNSSKISSPRAERDS